MKLVISVEVSDIDLRQAIEDITGQKFNKENKILSPFSNEKTPSFAIYFDSNNNKWKFKDFSSGKNGDAIDFVKEVKGISYNEAREYLGLTIEKSEQEKQIERVQGFIDWQIKKFGWKDKLIGLFPFTNDKGKIAYFKAKFKDNEGKKRLSYYHIEDDKVVNKRGSEEFPYNLYEALQGIENGKILIISEGEKDANLLNNVLSKNKYVATSVKNVKDLSKLRDANIYVCGDTGEAGKKYIKWIKSELLQHSNIFKVINLPGIEKLGDNKDVGDWMETGHTENDLLEAFNRSLDLKNKYELQQDHFGIYKTIFSEGNEKRKYIANFSIETAYNIKFVDENSEGIKLVLKSPLGNIIERIDKVSVFDDLKSFRNFLGSMDLVFTGATNDLMALKVWIRKYFALTDKEIYTGTCFLFNKSGELGLITQKGTITSQKYNSNILSDGGASVDILNIEPVSKEELQELRKYMFNFTTLDKSYSIIGTIINNLAVAQTMKLNIKLHHLLIVGESGSGKSTILENVIAAILNYPKDAMKSIGEITRFALIKNLSEGNYSILFEEHKPSRMRESQVLMISEILRNLYDRHSIDRGNRNLINKTFPLTRPLIIAGEERYSNGEKALYERSCIVYLSKGQRTKGQTAAMEWLINHQDILNKLGRSIIEQIISLPVEEYKKIREDISSKIKNLKDRPLNTAINICCGIEILNRVFANFGVEEVKDYESLVVKNIFDEIVDTQNAIGTEVEEILILFNQMIEDDKVTEPNKIVKVNNKTVCIRTSEMFNQIYEYIKRIGLKKQILEVKDFRKQAKLAGYILKLSGGTISVNGKNYRGDNYSKEKLSKLKVYEIVPEDFTEVDFEEGEQEKIYSNVMLFKK